MSEFTGLLEFVDILGISRGMCIPKRRWDEVRRNGTEFGSNIFDYYESLNNRGTLGADSVGPSEGDIHLSPDTSSEIRLELENGDVKKINCNVTWKDSDFPFCTRTILDEQIRSLLYCGFTPIVGTDLEFTLLSHFDERHLEVQGAEYLADVAIDQMRPYSTGSLVKIYPFLAQVKGLLSGLEPSIRGIHKESAPGLFEVITDWSDPLSQADLLMSLRLVLKLAGSMYDITPSFMPRPFEKAEGSGQHFHISLWRDTNNVFTAQNHDSGLSEIARLFIGGLIHHADSLTAICAPTVNSYKRLDSWSWAPVDSTYGYGNRTCMIRIPPGRGVQSRIEVRLPDSSANPYLALAAILAAGRDGIEREYDPGDPVSENRYRLSDNQASLPETLDDALDALLADDYLIAELGEELIDQYNRVKRNEVNRFRSSITDWETREYITRF